MTRLVPGCGPLRRPAVQQQELLVDEVANEAALATHPDVIWCGDFSNLTALRADWSTFPNFYDPSVTTPPEGWPTLTLSDSVEYGVRQARFESCSLTPDTRRDGIDSSSKIMLMNKYLNENTREMFTGSTIGSVPLNDLYMRFATKIEADVETGFNDLGCKLGGFETGNNSFAHTSTMGWFAPPSGGQADLYLYMAGDDVPGSSGPGSFTNVPVGVTINLDEWFTYEIHMKVNDTGMSNGTRRVWVNDVLVYEALNVAMHNIASYPIELHRVHGQIYHGGVGVPLTPMHFQTLGWVLARRRIGAPRPL